MCRQSRSPDPDRHRRRGGRGRSPVIQAVYKDSGGSTTWPMLSKTNYYEWASIMKLKLQARQLWDAIEYGDLPHHEDRRTVKALIAAVPQEMQMPLSEKATAKEAWDSLATARIGGERARRTALQRLRREWELLSFRPGEQAEDFTLRLIALKQQLALHGDTDINEERAVEKLLRAAPAKYAQLCIAIETLLDFQDLTIEEVSGRLKAVDDLQEVLGEPLIIAGKRMLSEEHWHARQKERKKGVQDSASASGKEPRRHPRGGKKQRAKNKYREDDGERKANRNDICLNCKRPGHWARGCCYPPRQGGGGGRDHGGQQRGGRGGGGGARGAAHVAEVDSDDDALFFAHGVVQLEKSPEVLCT